ncbi:MAG: hypothetical protein IKL79_03935 [Clostridia bacterium]|nr:hypothetical protein [Clostridia bacterium]MBR3681134.1 hypothetical protein [Clostridia bacterium]
MTAVANPYDALYTNLKNRFTVIHDGKECTVGDFMLMKAGKAAKGSSALTVVSAAHEHNTLATIADYVNDKLTVKNPPVKDKTIRRFPIKTSASALLSSVAACALVMSCGIFALTGGKDASGLSLERDGYEYEYVESVEEADTDEVKE